MTSNTISIPEYCLVLLVGASGSGKSTFAARHFLPTEIVSSDRCRAVVADDESDQSATADAFELVRFIAEKRLNARRSTVIDATNVRPEDRRAFVDLAKRYHALVVAFVFDMPEALCHERNAGRAERNFGPHVVRNHQRALKRGIRRMDREGIRFVYRFSDPARVDDVVVERQRLWVDKRDEIGPFDIIGDVHGCADELEQILIALGYHLDIQETSSGSGYSVIPPVGRKVVFLGDLVDRGPRIPDTLRLVKSMVDDILMPIVGFFTGGVDFTSIFTILGDGEYDSLAAAQEAGAATINWGVFINNCISFLIVAWVVFMLVKAMNAAKRKVEEAPAEPAAPPREEVLLEEVRDILAKS